MGKIHVKPFTQDMTNDFEGLTSDANLSTVEIPNYEEELFQQATSPSSDMKALRKLLLVSRHPDSK